MVLRYIAIFIVSAGLLSGCSSCSDEVHSNDSDGWEMPEGCGDLFVGDDELCDGSDLDGMTCADFGYSGGELSCNDTCTGFLVGECTGVPDWTPTVPPPCLDCADGEYCRSGECVDVDPEALADDELAFDLRIHTVKGRVTLAGQQLTSPGEPNGSVVFQSTESEHQFSAALEDDGSYKLELYEGSYRVFWSGVRNDDLPRMGVELTTSPVDIADTAALDYDLPQPVRFEGTLAVSNPAGPFSGRMTIERLDQNLPESTSRTPLRTTAFIHFSEGDAPRFSTLLFPGDYRGTFRSDTVTDLSEFSKSFVLFDALELTEALEQTFEIPVHRIEAQVRIPDSLQGTLRPFRDAMIEVPEATHATTAGRPDIDENGRFSARVYPGEYVIAVSIEEDGFEYGHTLRKEVHVDQDTSVELVLDEEFATITGQIFGVPAREFDDGHPPKVTFRGRGGSALGWRSAPLDEDGRFSIGLPPGEYDVSMELRPLAQVAFTGDEHFEYWVDELPDRVSVQGFVTVLGEQMPDNTRGDATRAKLTFEAVDGLVVGERITAELSATGPARYEVELLPDTAYRVSLQTPRPSDFGLASPSDALPDGGYVLHPRLQVDRDRRYDLDIKLVSLSGQVTAAGQTLPTADELAPNADAETIRGAISAVLSGHGGCCGYYNPEDQRFEPTGPVNYDLTVWPGYHTLTVGLGLPTTTITWSQGVAAGDDATFDLDVPLHQTQVHLTHDRASPVADKPLGHLRFETAIAESITRVDADGTAQSWWLGYDPQITFIGPSDLGFPAGPVLLRDVGE